MQEYKEMKWSKKEQKRIKSNEIKQRENIIININMLKKVQKSDPKKKVERNKKNEKKWKPTISHCKKMP